VVPCQIKSTSGGLDVNLDNKTVRISFENLLIEVDVLGRPYCFLAVADTVVATDPPT
jgi:hypothetical protein